MTAPFQRPDGARALDLTSVGLGSHASELPSEQLAARVFTLHGRPWLGAGGLGRDLVSGLLEASDSDLGLHLARLGAGGLEQWLAWEGLSKLEHLSFNGAFLKAKGLAALLASERIGQLRSLDLSVCDIGLKGLRQLKEGSQLPHLEELYLHANPDFDRTRYDVKALAALLEGSAKKPVGENLRGLRKLGLLFWQLADATKLLEENALLAELDELWISDSYYAPPKQRSNVRALPSSLRPRCVVGWERAAVEA